MVAPVVNQFGPEWALGDRFYVPTGPIERGENGNLYAPFEDTTWPGEGYRSGLLVRSAKTGRVLVFWDGGIVA